MQESESDFELTVNQDALFELARLYGTARSTHECALGCMASCRL